MLVIQSNPLLLCSNSENPSRQRYPLPNPLAILHGFDGTLHHSSRYEPSYLRLPENAPLLDVTAICSAEKRLVAGCQSGRTLLASYRPLQIVGHEDPFRNLPVTALSAWRDDQLAVVYDDGMVSCFRFRERTASLCRNGSSRSMNSSTDVMDDRMLLDAVSLFDRSTKGIKQRRACCVGRTIRWKMLLGKSVGWKNRMISCLFGSFVEQSTGPCSPREIRICMHTETDLGSS